jgi:hypothetical protein
VYFFLDGVSLRVRRPGGRKRAHAGGLWSGCRRWFNAARERVSLGRAAGGFVAARPGR